MKRRAGGMAAAGGGDFLKSLVAAKKAKTAEMQKELRPATVEMPSGTSGAEDMIAQAEEEETVTTFASKAELEKEKIERLRRERIAAEEKKIQEEESRLKQLATFYHEPLQRSASTGSAHSAGSGDRSSNMRGSGTGADGGGRSSKPPVSFYSEKNHISNKNSYTGSSAASRKNSLKFASEVEKKINDDDATPAVALADIIQRLRELGREITLFGEKPMQRYRRLRRLETESLMRDSDDLRVGGQANIFQQELQTADTEAALVELVASGVGNMIAKSPHGDDSCTNSEDESGAPGKNYMKNSNCSTVSVNRSTSSPGGEHHLMDGGNNSCGSPLGAEEEDDDDDPTPKHKIVEHVVRAWMRKYLRIWEESLGQRADEERISSDGKVQTALFRQSKKDLQPLLKRLKKRDVEKPTVDLLKEMIDLCEERNYRGASEKYIQLTVGNAAWPVGVTSVGIHERVGRSKISSSNISHTLNDDTTRKYMQVFKRLMKQCQNVYPPIDNAKAL